MTPDALSALMSYDYPGNVRELENIVERAFILCKEGMIGLGCLPQEIIAQETRPVVDFPTTENPLKAAEAKAILRALAGHNGHRARTAKALGIHKTTLIRKMKRLGITYP